MCYPGHKLLDLDSKPCKSTKLLNALCLLILDLNNMNPLPCHGVLHSNSIILNEASVLMRLCLHQTFCHLKLQQLLYQSTLYSWKRDQTCKWCFRMFRKKSTIRRELIWYNWAHKQVVFIWNWDTHSVAPCHQNRWH